MGRGFGGHLFRLDVKPCAVARRGGGDRTRASAPNVHEEDGQWKCGRAGTCRMRISRRTLLDVGVGRGGSFSEGWLLLAPALGKHRNLAPGLQLSA